MRRLAALVALLALTAVAAPAPFLPGVPCPLERVNATAQGCSCVLYAAPDCPEARDEFVCMSDCVERGYIFPDRCDSVLGCCAYLETVNAEVRCTDEGSSVRFDCGVSPLRSNLSDRDRARIRARTRLPVWTRIRG